LIIAEVQQRAEISRTEEIKQSEEKLRAMQNKSTDLQMGKQAEKIKDQEEIIKLKDEKIKDQEEIIKLKDEKIKDQEKIIKLKDKKIKDQEEIIKLKDEIIERDRIQREKNLETIRAMHALNAQLQAAGATGVGPQLPNDPADTTFDSALRRMKKLYVQASENKIYVIGGVVICIVGCALLVYGGSVLYSYLLTFGAKEVPQSIVQLSSAGIHRNMGILNIGICRVSN